VQGEPTGKKENFMKKQKEFPFKKARRITSREVQSFKKGIEEKLGKKRPTRGRPPKSAEAKFAPISIRLHPLALAWAKKEAEKRGVGYQTIINEVLLTKAAA
jgi:predicted DNA binding CopG/RHH family protein